MAAWNHSSPLVRGRQLTQDARGSCSSSNYCSCRTGSAAIARVATWVATTRYIRYCIVGSCAHCLVEVGVHLSSVKLLGWVCRIAAAVSPVYNARCAFAVNFGVRVSSGAVVPELTDVLDELNPPQTKQISYGAYIIYLARTFPFFRSHTVSAPRCTAGGSMKGRGTTRAAARAGSGTPRSPGARYRVPRRRASRVPAPPPPLSLSLSAPPSN